MVFLRVVEEADFSKGFNPLVTGVDASQLRSEKLKQHASALLSP